MTDREPLADGGRRSGDMPASQPSPASPHAGHDLELLAAALDRDADPALAAAAASQVATCRDCAALDTELRLLTGALAELSGLAAATAPRDMRLTPDQAARLRRGGFVRRLLRPFGVDGSPVIRPLAAALTTLGLAGILLNSLPLGLGGLGFLGGAALAPAEHTTGSAADQQASARPIAMPAASAAVEPMSGDVKGFSASPAVPAQGQGGQQPAAAASGSAGGGFADGSTGTPAAAPPAGGPQLPALAWVSLALVALGLGLFAARLVARRVT